MPKTRTTRIGNGAGHGGPAKGNVFMGSQGPSTALPRAAAFEPGNTYGAIPTDKERQAWRKQTAWELENHLRRLAVTAEREDTQVAASVKLHAICDGMPTARIEAKITRSAEDLSEEELLEIAGRNSSVGG